MEITYPAKENVLHSFHLFAGAGGGILADILLGHIPVGAVEIEDYPREVLLQRQRDGVLPTFPIWDDILTFDGRPWRGLVDILAGGFPCQDLSTQGANHGKKQGLDGDRSGLWAEYKRLIGEVEPRFIFAENSPNLRTRGLVRILKNLAELGYDARWCKLGGCHVGADHRRERLWILAYSNGDRLEGRNYFDSEGPRDSAPRPMEGLRESKVWANLPPPDAFGIANGMAAKLDRLTAIGNGQIPAVAAFAFALLSRGLGKGQLEC
jgi:DNA (cytosine-5)-methyltransferase 1